MKPLGHTYSLLHMIHLEWKRQSFPYLLLQYPLALDRPLELVPLVGLPDLDGEVDCVEVVQQIIVVDARMHKHLDFDLLVLDLALLADLELSLPAGGCRKNRGVEGCRVQVQSWIPTFRELMLSHYRNLL